MGIFNKSKQTGGFMDEIRCDEPSYLIWKWHPAGVQESEGNRENSIRWGSSLRVKDGEVAVFVYKRDSGVMQDFIVGPYDEKIKTSNFPILAKIVGLAFEGGTPFQAEIYFINLARVIQTKFAVPFFDVYDPRFDDFSVPVAVRGTMTFCISDYREFIKLHRLNTFNIEDFQKQIKDVVIRYVKDVVTNAPSSNNIPVIQIETKIAQITDVVEYDIKDRLRENFGVDVTGIDINAIEIDKTSDGYNHLMSATRDVNVATIQAKKEAEIKNIHDMQRINAENYQESLRIQREEGQYAAHKTNQTQNFAAYQVEAQTQVGVAGAEALGHIGENGAGGVNLGDSVGGIGFNPAAMMAGMAMGGAVGQNLANTMNGAMSQINQMGIITPPVPSSYNVVINGQAAGPFDISTLKQMVSEGRINGSSLVWKNGMQDWCRAENVQELAVLFGNGATMPPIPPTV